ncbi:MAG: hypothetical protein ACJAUL_003603, partial [Paraglaciecola sp.]
RKSFYLKHYFLCVLCGEKFFVSLAATPITLGIHCVNKKIYH